jgi:hypothetical protein
VILNIAKAYDTVDRSFVFRIMEAAGCGRPICGGSSCCSATLVHTLQFMAMSRRAKSGRLVLVRAALSLRSSTFSWRRHSVTGLLTKSVPRLECPGGQSAAC